MASFFTNISIGITLGVLVLLLGITSLVYIFTPLSVQPTLPTDIVEAQQAQILEISNAYVVESDETEVNERTTDLAQLQGLVDTERGKLDFAGSVSAIWNILTNTVPGIYILTPLLLSLFSVLMVAGVYSLWRQLMP